MHGEGTYTAGKSYAYRNAMLVNGCPVGWPFRLSISKSKSSTLQLTEEPITITVDIVDSTEASSRAKADCGRLLRLRCGQRTNQPTDESLPTPLYVVLSLGRTIGEFSVVSAVVITSIWCRDRPESRQAMNSLVISARSLRFEHCRERVCSDLADEEQPVDDCVVTTADGGRAQFAGITVDTFAIRHASSLIAST